MSKFELFCMIFFVLDADWDENKDATVGEYLSGANPFLFTDIGSADPAVYIKFSEIITEEITIKNSYALAKKYISYLGCENITNAFSSINEEEWGGCVSEFLSKEHKGES